VTSVDILTLSVTCDNNNTPAVYYSMADFTGEVDDLDAVFVCLYYDIRYNFAEFVC